MQKNLFALGGVFLAGLLCGGLLFDHLTDRKLDQFRDEMRLQQYLHPASARTERTQAFQPTTEFRAAADSSVNAVVYLSTAGRYGRFGSAGTGSGVIISDNGYIVTNYHVVEDASEVTVILNDKREYTARVVGSDPNTDLAVLKVEAEDLPVLRFGNSDDVAVGQWVLAVGNPFRLTSTVTTGIVSAKARNIGLLRRQTRSFSGRDYSIESFIQTDAAVNPGNSGGALVNLNGELVGINTAIASETGSYQGYSFAIPSNLVQKVVSDLIAYGSVQRAYLGVSIRDITADAAEEYELGTLQGALVADIIPNGAAKLAGIRSGDVLTHVNGASIGSASELQEQVARYKPGDQITVTLLRGKQQLKKVLTLRNEAGSTRLVESSRTNLPNTLRRLGATLMELDEQDLAEMNLRHGIRLDAVITGGACYGAGLRPGMVITRLNGKPVYSVTSFLEKVAEAEGTISIEARKHGGKPSTYVIRLAD